MFTNRRPYYGLKMSTTDFFREPVRFLKESNTQESMMEKPYYQGEYHKMHLSLPDFKFKPRERPGPFGPIIDEAPIGGFAKISFGEAKCNWGIARADDCISGSVTVTMYASCYWGEDFKFVAGIASDSIGVVIGQLPPTDSGAWDTQDYLITFPEDATGSVTICGFASTHTLVSQVFETVVAGMPVVIDLIGGALRPIEKFHGKSPVLLKSTYGEKGADCGCITLSSDCTPVCECKLIGFTSQQMDINETQGLMVIDPDPDCEYGWFITTGGGGLSPLTGTSTTYTAPSSNDGCGNNPTITLTVDGSPCDTLDIAVNAYPNPSHNASYANGAGCFSAVTEGGQLCGSNVCAAPYCWQCCMDKLACDGTLIETTYSNSCWDYNEDPGCGANWCSQFCSNTNITDVRTDAMKEQGCCPSELL